MILKPQQREIIDTLLAQNHTMLGRQSEKQKKVLKVLKVFGSISVNLKEQTL